MYIHAYFRTYTVLVITFLGCLLQLTGKYSAAEFADSSDLVPFQLCLRKLRIREGPTICPGSNQQMFLGMLNAKRGDLEREVLSHSDTLHLVLGFIVETLWVEGKKIKPLNQELSNPSASYPHPSNLQPLLPLPTCFS